MLIMNRNVEPTDKIYKYHISQSEFADDDIRKIVHAIRKKWEFVFATNHFEKAVKLDIHKYTSDSIDDILVFGRCFEYKLIDNEYLYRLVFKVYHDDFDIVYVIEPKYYSGKVLLVLITSYTNDKGDIHKTLDINKYSHVK